MSDSTGQITQLATSQAGKEQTVNELFAAASPAMLFGRSQLSSGLNWTYFGGRVQGVLLPNGTLALSASTTSYVEATVAGVVSKNETGFTAGSVPLYKIVTGLSTVLSYEDHRPWVNLAAAAVALQPYLLCGFYPGKPDASALVGFHDFTLAVAFPSSLTGSKAKAKVAATAQTDFDIQKNGASVGTIRFAGSGTVASFIAAAGSTFAAGDDITVIAPGTPDATLSDITFTLMGTR
jgi:hypothetical protein